MPLFEFCCEACAARVELLLKPDEIVPCPACGEWRLDKRLSSVAAPAGRARCAATGREQDTRTPPASSSEQGHVHTASCKHGYVDAVVRKHRG